MPSSILPPTSPRTPGHVWAVSVDLQLSWLLGALVSISLSALILILVRHRTSLSDQPRSRRSGAPKKRVKKRDELEVTAFVVAASHEREHESWADSVSL